MPLRTWVFIAALGCLNPISGQAQEQGQATQGSAQAQQEPAPTLPIPFPVDVIEDEATAQARERSEAETAQREKDDLVAQQGMNSATQAMNEATQRMAYYSVLSTWLVGIGTSLLIVTLWLTRQANKAAQAAVDVTREIGVRQTRAYLNVEKFTLIGHELRAEYKNRGVTPAHNVRGRIVWVFLEGKSAGLPDDYIFQTSTCQTESVSLIGPGEGRDVRYLDCPLPFDQISAGDVTLFVFVSVGYRDVFGEDRVTEEAMRFNLRKDGSSGFDVYGNYSRGT